MHAGEKIVLDGVVIEGEGSCDESLMTGEAIPVVKCLGSRLLSGSILLNGSLAFQVQTMEESALHQIIEMIEKDIHHKKAYVRAVDVIVRWFVPLILLVAISTSLTCLFLEVADPGKTVFQTAILRAVAVLLISCPCAIGIAAPLAESHLLNRLASWGVIVRNKGCLPFLGTETVFIFDKTGTITEGKFSVLSGLEKLTSLQRSVLRGLADCSIHPIACAIAKTIEEEPFKFKKVEEIAGKGIWGELEGTNYLLGSAKFLTERGIDIHSLPVEGFLTTVYFAQGKVCIAVLALGDQIRIGAKDVIASLKPSKTILLSGNAQPPVEAVAASCGFDDWRWGYSPLQKREYVLGCKQNKEVVCMIGDGINDAPALTAADVGISVLSASDMSIQVSDILLTTDRLGTISAVRLLAKKGRKILKQNLFWAFFYNIVGVFLAIFGFLSPIFAAFAMAASSLMVLFNARRL